MKRILTSWKFWVIIVVIFGGAFLLRPGKVVEARDTPGPNGQQVGLGYKDGKAYCVKDNSDAPGGGESQLVQAYRAQGGEFHKYGDKLEARECGIQPVEEFDLNVPRNTLVDIPAIGFLDFSITKPVFYLMLATLLICLGAFLLSKRLKLDPSKPQTTAEALYSFVQENVMRGLVPERAYGQWFPYIATLFIFIYVSNLIGFIPLPFGTDSSPGFNWGIYAATGNINVPLALALITFISSHYMGVKNNGMHYFASWAPSEGNIFVRGALWVLHAFSELFRPISLTVRLFANLLAGHLLIGILLGLIFVFGTFVLVPVWGGVALVIYLFEVILVCAIQAYIFAVLSAAYIGGAIEPDH